MNAHAKFLLVVLIVVLFASTVTTVALAGGGIASDLTFSQATYVAGADLTPVFHKIPQPGGPLPPCWAC